jgi:hypothetical protein
MYSKDKSSVYLSIFKRKGGEGDYTKIVNDENKNQYSDLLDRLVESENPLIVYFKNILNWFLLTNSRILIMNESNFEILSNSDIIEVLPALEEEFKDRIISKENFTRLKIKTTDNVDIILSLEMGKSYEGIYQVLHFIKSNNLESS